VKLSGKRTAVPLNPGRIRTITPDTEGEKSRFLRIISQVKRQEEGATT